MKDDEYRQQLISSGVLSDRIEGLSAHMLDCVGNIVGVFRTTMQEQNPSAFAIERARKAKK